MYIDTVHAILLVPQKLHAYVRQTHSNTQTIHDSVLISEPR